MCPERVCEMMRQPVRMFIVSCWFSGYCQDLFLQSRLSVVPEGKVDAWSGDTQNIITISPNADPTQCLDATQDVVPLLQLWECNGLESQLWYFDSGSYKIQWGGDRSMCVDAGSSVTGGTRLILWNCNGLEQQVWGYGSDLTIYLAKSRTDAAYCMDLAGGAYDSGTAVQIWNCNGLANQQWQVSRGITLRLASEYQKCLDLAGGSTDNGTPIQLWDCNGLSNQKWFFDNYQIKAAADSSKCIDAGNMLAGTRLWLWDCNSLSQQFFGYDPSAMTVWLSNSAADASLCMDLMGGRDSAGTLLEVWSCNGCWNQMFQIVGPLSSSLSSERRSVSPTMTSDLGCPSPPGPPPPSPSPAPGPSPNVYGHCESQNAGNYPVFLTEVDLQGDAAWSCYFKKVFGVVPTDGYPICIYSMYKLYSGIAKTCGISLGTPSELCPMKNGELFGRFSYSVDPSVAWIWNNDLMRGQSSFSVESQKWVEVLHNANPIDGAATWLYYTPGSSIWFWTGNSKPYNDHPDAVKDLLGERCVSASNECVHYFRSLFNAMKTAGLDSISFVKHADMECSPLGMVMNLAIEIVDIAGPGEMPCGGQSGWVRFKAGWQASNACFCEGTKPYINCKGYGGSR